MDSGESIYDLIPRPQEAVPKPPIYRSIHDGRVDPRQFEMGTGSVRGKATFGPPRGTLKPDTHTYLRKHGKEPVLPDPAAPTHTKPKVKPGIPKEKPIMGLVSGKNFITANAVETILSPAKKPKDPPPPATMRKGYGKVPTYLTDVKRTIRQEKEQIENLTMQRMQEHHNTRSLDEEERQALITGLKGKWQRINEAYQKLAFVLDTPTKRARKEQYEAELATIEKDIETLSRRVVLVNVSEND